MTLKKQQSLEEGNVEQQERGWARGEKRKGREGIGDTEGERGEER